MKQHEYAKSKGVPLVSEVRTYEKAKKKLLQEQRNGSVRVTSERNAEINKDNLILLSKLVDISSGKFTSIPKSKNTFNTHSVPRMPAQTSLQRNSSNRSNNLRSVLSNTGMEMVRSLNIGFRKKEIERIEAEN